MCKLRLYHAILQNRGKHYLQCANRHVSADSCEGAFIPVTELEQIVLGELNRLSAEYLDKDALEQNLELEDNLHGRKERLLTELTAYKKKSRKIPRASVSFMSIRSKDSYRQKILLSCQKSSLKNGNE